MPIDHGYTLQDLADLADVTTRTIRYYIAQGLLPAPGKVGPGTTYGDGHLARLRLIRRLAHEHLPLAEIRSRLSGLDDAAVAGLVETPATNPAQGSAVDYIRGLLGREDTLRPYPGTAPPPGSAPIPGGGSVLRTRLPVQAEPSPRVLRAGGSTAAVDAPAGPERSQWERLVLTPDVELHVRRPLTRHQNKRVERLISIARSLFEGDQS